MNLIAKELKCFLSVSFLGAWMIWSIALLKSYEIIHMPLSNNLIRNLGAYAPSIAGILLTGLYGGKKKLEHFLVKSSPIRLNIRLWLYTFLLMPGILVSAYLFSKIVWDIKYDFPLLKQPLLIIVVFFYILFLGGPLGEEFGWRGFALRRLLDRYSPLSASMILGVIWSIWHGPLFFIQGSVQQNINFIGYMVYTLLLTIMMTILFIKSSGNIFLAILFHTISNLSLGIFPIFTTVQGGGSILLFMFLVTSILIIFNREILLNNS